jgi:hypothetical protein
MTLDLIEESVVTGYVYDTTYLYLGFDPSDPRLAAEMRRLATDPFYPVDRLPLRYRVIIPEAKGLVAAVPQAPPAIPAQSQPATPLLLMGGMIPLALEAGTGEDKS